MNQQKINEAYWIGLGFEKVFPEPEKDPQWYHWSQDFENIFLGTVIIIIAQGFVEAFISGQSVYRREYTDLNLISFMDWIRLPTE